MIDILSGIKIQVSPYAVRIEYTVKPWPIKKRRRGWYVVKETVPCAYMIGGHTMVVHPEHAVQLRGMK